MKGRSLSTRVWILGILAVALVSVGILGVRAANAGGTVAVITQGGTEVRRIDLDRVEAPYTLTFDTEDGGHNCVLVEPGGISVTEANCPDQVCVRQGTIHNDLLPIVCLPNELVVTIEGAGEETAVDTVAQ